MPLTTAQIDKVIAKAIESCRRSGTRLTDKRKNLLALLLASETPLSAYELAEQYGKHYSTSIPPMSVYRMLDFLVGENLVHKLSSESKFIACSHIACDHTHQVPQFLICGQCRKVREIGIDADIIQALRGNVTNAGYRLLSSQLELQCLCHECADQIPDSQANLAS